MTSTTISYNDTKYVQGKAYFSALYASGRLPECSKGFVSGRCATGHMYASNVICGKEYCEDCGKDGSPQHQKRFNRWLPKVKSLESCGFFVFTLPKQLWGSYMNKIRLSAFRTALKNKLKRIGFDRGLMRWHLYGDCHTCNGHGCNVCKYTGAGKEYKPHLNVIVEWGFMDNINENAIMLSIKQFVKDYLKKKHQLTLLNPVINYSYADKKNEKTISHQVKYITRATFRIYEQSAAEILKNYRLTTTWGTFKPVYSTITKDEKLDNSICPKCDKPIIWSGFKHEINFTHLINLQNGKFEIPPDELRRTDTPCQIDKNEIGYTPQKVFRAEHTHAPSMPRLRRAHIQRSKPIEVKD